MPYKVRCCLNFDCLNISGIICLISTVPGVGFLVANITINNKFQNQKENCIDEIMDYSWASLFNLLFILGICVFSLVAVDTEGKFDNCNSRNDNDLTCFCCIPGTSRCFAGFMWICLFAGSLSLAIIGTLSANDNFFCLPQPLQILTVFSLGIQYLTIPVSLIGMLFRCGCLEYEQESQTKNFQKSNQWV